MAKTFPSTHNLSFLQELDLRDTKAIGQGLVQFAKNLNGLRSLKLSSSNGGSGAAKVFNFLAVGKLVKKGRGWMLHVSEHFLNMVLA